MAGQARHGCFGGGFPEVVSNLLRGWLRGEGEGKER